MFIKIGKHMINTDRIDYAEDIDGGGTVLRMSNGTEIQLDKGNAEKFFFELTRLVEKRTDWP